VGGGEGRVGKGFWWGGGGGGGLFFHYFEGGGEKTLQKRGFGDIKATQRKGSSVKISAIKWKPTIYPPPLGDGIEGIRKRTMGCRKGLGTVDDSQENTVLELRSEGGSKKRGRQGGVKKKVMGDFIPGEAISFRYQ